MEKKKILVVDDEESITTVFKMLIEKTGRYEACTEIRGSHAFVAAKRSKPDLVLLDIMMPGVDGGEVVRRMKADKETRDIPIVFVTAAVTKEEAKRQGTIHGGYPIIAKPVSEEELIETIEKHTGAETMAVYVQDAPSVGEKKAHPGDRRNHKRIQAGTLLSYVGLDENDTPVEEGMGNALNISQTGLLLETPLPMGAEYLQLTASNIRDELISIKGKVIYSHAFGPNVFHTGINFRDSAEKVHEFVVEFIKVFGQQKKATGISLTFSLLTAIPVTSQ